MTDHQEAPEGTETRLEAAYRLLDSLLSVENFHSVMDSVRRFMTERRKELHRLMQEEKRYPPEP
jgi:hypothetical protein